MSRLTVFATVAVLTTLLSGCGPTDEQLINTAMVEWKDALAAQDLDRMMAPYSEDFVGREDTTKADLRKFMGRFIDEGRLDGVELDIENATIDIEGDTATVDGLIITGDFGEFYNTRTLKKEKDKIWRIVTSEMER